MEELSPRLLDFDPVREAVVPRDAATVVVLRDGAHGLEIFCVRRHAKSSFLGGALVFPGGKLDPDDASAPWNDLATATLPRADVFATNGVSAKALAIAASRETLEEGAILPVTSDLDDAEIAVIRAELDGGANLASAIGKRGLRLRLDALVPWARWVTPEAESRRFDARFFLLELPRGQVGRHDERETTMSLWMRPAEVIDGGRRGQFLLAPPTSRTLELLADVRDVGAALALADEQTLRPIVPRFVPADETGAPYLALPGDPSHSLAERRVAGPTRYVLRDGRFQSEDAPG